MMATCFGPPPIPPKKPPPAPYFRPVVLDGSRNKRHQTPPQNQRRAGKMSKSSTYHSFREPEDDADDDIVVLGSEVVEMELITPKKPILRPAKITLKNSSNSLSRNSTANTTFMPLSLMSRSCSDGNISGRDASRKGMASVDVGGGTLNKLAKVLGASWKNLLQLGGMSRPPKPVATSKKVAPPAVPDVFRHSGSSFGSAGYSSSEDGCFLQPVDNHIITVRDGCDTGDVYGMAGKSPQPQYTYPAFTFPGPQGVTQFSQHTNSAAYYHHQMALQEDQGIDMTQSPGRDSPGSSGSGSGSRHSTASLDSGRASGYHLLGPGGPRSGTLSSSPRCSLSSSSLGSTEHGGPGARVERLLSQGVPDQDVMHAWLMDLHCEEYFPLFAAAGYDMPTVCRMTPEDLTAVGVKKPNVRKKLKAEIAQLTINDGLPDYIPGSVEEWLRLLRLEEYGCALHQQGYTTVEDVTQLTWEDLEDIGIVKLGHQKKVMLAVKRVKDVRAGKRFQPTTQALLSSPPAGCETPVDDNGGFPTGVHAAFRTFHTPWELETTQHLNAAAAGHALPHSPYFFQTVYCPDIVPIKIRGGRGKSLESLEDANERASHHTFSAENTQTFYFAGPGGWRPRSYDDGDITPTNETTPLHEGGGTLPRPRGLVRPRPVAKIPAKTRADFNYKSLPRDLVDIAKYNLDRGTYSTGTMAKRRPPSPPKRQSSRVEDIVIGDSVVVTVADLHAPLPAYPSTDELSVADDDLPLPPPPAPATPPTSKRLPAPNWGAEEQELIASLALTQPARAGSDASFKSSSSTESDSLPFANENAGTIKQRATRPHPALSTLDYPSAAQFSAVDIAAGHKALRERPGPQEPVDVLNDIGNMLANLTDELDAMLEEEKRQGLNQ